MFIVGVLQKRDLFEMLLISISLAVAAIPEGLRCYSNYSACYGRSKDDKEKCYCKKITCC